ncbi:hypothetical protein CCMA1212_000365 [Trichoderma ghanense]|uniref:Uncharacterized protein n=1 Tax=Trichoderma ghanense TaxID=65468 RepID=A0ABY2HGC2_9HYPO
MSRQYRLSRPSRQSQKSLCDPHRKRAAATHRPCAISPSGAQGQAAKTVQGFRLALGERLPASEREATYRYFAVPVAARLAQELQG